MIRIGFLFGAIWIAVATGLLLSSFSRWLFDDPPPPGDEYMGRHGLFFLRVFVSIFWWLMVLSDGGRRQIKYIMNGRID